MQVYCCNFKIPAGKIKNRNKFFGECRFLFISLNYEISICGNLTLAFEKSIFNKCARINALLKSNFNALVEN